MPGNIPLQFCCGKVLRMASPCLLKMCPPAHLETPVPLPLRRSEAMSVCSAFSAICGVACGTLLALAQEHAWLGGSAPRA
jgi:hypothetical protein